MTQAAVEDSVETAVMQIIRYCEAKGILNSHCSLSTIEGLRLSTLKKVRAYLKGLCSSRGSVACPECHESIRYIREHSQYYCAKCKGWLRFQ